MDWQTEAKIKRGCWAGLILLYILEMSFSGGKMLRYTCIKEKDPETRCTTSPAICFWPECLIEGTDSLRTPLGLHGFHPSPSREDTTNRHSFLIPLPAHTEEQLHDVDFSSSFDSERPN